MFTSTLMALLVLLAPIQADADAKAAQERIAEYLKSIRGAEIARVTPLTANSIAKTFPNHTLFGVMFPQYPVARLAPKPFSSSNVVAVPNAKDGKPVPIANVKQLESFFQANVKATTDDEATLTTQAWLLSVAELNQDGFYKFRLGDKMGVGEDPGSIMVSGTVTVDPKNGDKGDILATLTFKDGKLATTETQVKLTPGPRPRCQATKLLDPDPIVRVMAEDSIRMMGSAAKPYLDEQRAKASAQLRVAIDRVWARIVAEER